MGEPQKMTEETIEVDKYSSALSNNGETQPERITATEGGEDNNQEEKNEEEQVATGCQLPWLLRWLIDFYFEQQFLIHILLVIFLAWIYPPLGAEYLYPEITSTWIAVAVIFLLSGLTLRTEEFANAFKQLRFNIYVQLFNFGVVSSFVYGVSRALQEGNILNGYLADGMVIGASVPMTINTVIVLSKAADGDEAAGIFNAAFGNLIGVVLSPLLILGYVGVSGEIDFADVFVKLVLRIVLPLVVGQILRRTSQAVVDFMKDHKQFCSAIQQNCLVYTIYCVFCKTFDNGGTGSNIGDVFIMIFFVFLLLLILNIIAWYSLKFLFPHEPKLRVTGLYCCTHKTVAVGIPLINAIYGDDPAVALYTLPLLIWHPMQLVFGTLLTPILLDFEHKEEERLGLTRAEPDLAPKPDGEEEEEEPDVEVPRNEEPHNDEEEEKN